MNYVSFLELLCFYFVDKHNQYYSKLFGCDNLTIFRVIYEDYVIQ